ncbi:diguanylate cyclase/phosphodiesterase with PAS/PAC sensor [Pseudanabaena sp. lw0831]|uniref:EAL domain-containing protein n=1 Tax=Pseudanabaena sp. lw0831 TaxID=1357935 RepID=UPI0019166236|nr:EAL domain-containing protein [Pseudanabaena sp. lw0831]GBO52939.1 diguanylate cyclase/phosphodiesterase with PAS/PAC sensor [Pseudanabaena sp. lw0831]
MRSPFSEFISRLFPKLLTNYQAKRWRSRLVSLICRALPTIFAIIIIIPMVYLGFLQTIEFWAYNSFTNWRGDRPWDERVIIIAIDDRSLSKIGRFPWTRNLYVQLIQKLEQTEASIVGFDILWSEESPADQQLAAAISRYQKVVLAMAWDKSGQPLLPIAPINSAGVAIGHILKREDADGVVRQVDLQIQNIPTFAVSILQAYDLTTASNTLLPELDQTLTINWTKRVKDIPQISFSDVIDGKIPASTFRNKIVLIGVTASGIDDLVTPLDRNPPASGVHLHAMALQNLLQKNSFAVAKPIDIWSIALLGSLFIGLVLPRQNLWTGSISAFVLSGLWLIVTFIAFKANYLIEIAVPILMFLLTGFAIALQERWQMQRSLKLADSQLQYESTHDHLTGLYNRALIETRLQNLLHPQDVSSQSGDHQRLIAIFWINLDRFKTINDTFGHPVGNLLLVAVSQCLCNSIPPNASVARFGGAEFVILLENPGDQQEAIAIADRIQTKLQNPFTINDHEIEVEANIGIKFHQINRPDNPDSTEIISPELLLRDADTAMFYAKKLGNSCNKVFDISMRERVLKRLKLEKDLRKAVALCQDPSNQNDQEFLIYYQPILSLSDMEIVGLEALIRWKHPERGLISPIQFIPLAEETGLIIPIGDWIMRNACLQVKSWQQRFPKAKDITISVNLSPKQLAQDDVLEKCLSVLDQTQLSSEYLKIELTESSIMENPDFAISILSQMRQAGIKIYIDDFGTGYSSLAYLHEFPFDGLKIDRSFVNNIHKNSNGMEILQAIISLAHSVKAHIVAEGIENLAQLNYLQDLLSEEGDGQGFFLFRPLDVAAIEAIFQTT